LATQKLAAVPLWKVNAGAPMPAKLNRAFAARFSFVRANSIGRQLFYFIILSLLSG
jgi:hypothetical protein